MDNIAFKDNIANTPMMITWTIQLSRTIQPILQYKDDYMDNIAFSHKTAGVRENSLRKNKDKC